MHWKKNTIWGMVLLCSLIILASCSADNENPPQSNIDWEYIEKGIVLDQDINTINISSDVFSIAFEPSPDEHAHVTFNSNAMKEVEEYFAIKYIQEDDHLEIAVKAVKNMIGSDVLDLIRAWNAAFLIQLPEHRYDTITLSSNIGNISLQHTQVDELAATNDVGEIYLSNTHSNTTQLENAVGTVKLENISGQTHVKNSTGTVSVQLDDISDDLDIETALGAVNISLSKHPEQIGVDLITEIGSVDTNLDLSFSKNTRRSVVGQTSSEGPTIKVRTAVGKISVQHQ